MMKVDVVAKYIRLSDEDVDTGRSGRGMRGIFI